MDKEKHHFFQFNLKTTSNMEQDGIFILYGTDVGGIFRSTNGGDMFEPAKIAHNASVRM